MNVIATIVLYKHSKEEIEKTIHSLLSEKYVSKIVLVDNGAFCSWAQEPVHPKIETIVLPDNIGFGAGHNTVLTKYTNQTEYFLICNPDCYFDKGELDKLYIYSMYNDLDLSVPKILYTDNKTQYNCKLLPTPAHLFLRRFFPKHSKKHDRLYELRDADLDQPFVAPFYSGCFMLVSNRAIKQVKGFDPRFFLYMEDVDFSRRVVSQFKTSFCPDATVTHEFKKASYKNWRFLKVHTLSAIRYFNKWGWLFDKERTALNNQCTEQLPKTKNECL